MQEAGTGPTELQAQVDRSLGEIQRSLLDGVVVPFIGAGISNACKPPRFLESGTCDSSHRRAWNEGRPGLADFEPRTEDLKRSLVTFLWARCKSSPDTAKRTAELLGVSCLHDSKDEGEFVEKCQKNASLSLDRLAEVCTWLSDSRSVCEALRIERFTTLVPRPAHRYIAYLVREGLIDEIVTTNWDTCIERALTCSFGPRRALRIDGQGEGDGSAFHRLRRVDEYRRWGAFRRRGRGRRRPVLRLYKINGCAAAYARDAAAEADRIALTEHQLQGFRDNHWAADLFRDRARTHRLLFSGFGSAEPQIRHAVMALVQEFRAFPDEARGLRHAPFVHVYKEAPTFHQYQLLRAYYTEEGSDLRVGLRHVVTGNHAGRFPDPSLPHAARAENERPDADRRDANRLDADRFWFGLYLVAMRGLVDRYSESQFPFYAWLARCCTTPAQEVVRLRRWLYPAPCGTDGNGCTAPCEATFGRLVALFRPTATAWDRSCGWPYQDTGSGPMRLWVWLAAIRGLQTGSSEVGCRGHDWYLPVRDASLLVLSSLYVLMMLAPDLSSEEVDRDTASARPDPGGVGLNVRVGDRTGAGEDTPPFDVMVVAREARNPPKSIPDANANKRTAIRYQLAVPTRLTDVGVRVGRWERTGQDPSGKNRVRTLRTGRFVQLPAHTIDFAGHSQQSSGGQRQEPRTVHAIRLAAASLLPRTRARLERRAAYGSVRT